MRRCRIARICAQLRKSPFLSYVLYMFRNLPLDESFAFVASPEEWETFRSFGEVSATDLWINAMAAGAGELDEYYRLRTVFLGRVRDRLRSGEWLCEGFDPTQGSELRSIPSQLWRSLEFDPHADEVSGAGFRFVNLLMSASMQAVEAPAEIPGSIRLSDVIELAATPDEAAQYDRLKSAAQSLGAWVLGASETDYERRHRLCRELQDRVWNRVLPSLLSGKWEARAFVHGQLQRVAIPAELWSELRCDFSKDEAYSGSDLGLQFNKVVLNLRPQQKPAAAAGSLRRRLNGWLKQIAAAPRTLVRRAELLNEARRELVDASITLNMLDDCIRETGLGPLLLYKGRPPA
jgi:hypothetical protein